MKLAMVGLGKMGANMVRRLVRDGHTLLVYDVDPNVARLLADEHETIEAADSLHDLIAGLPVPRVVWLMVPHEHVDASIDAVIKAGMESGDLIVDGGNSNYRLSMRRAERLARQNILFADCGTSGGVWGLQNGYSLMVGGSDEAVGRLRPALESLAPAPDRGWGHVGPAGAGHYVKMIHNGIEYGMMQALAEGFELMHAKQDFGIDLAQVAGIWQDGSVVRSWLLDLVADALKDDAGIEALSDYVEDSGEGRWTVQDAIEQGIPAPVLSLALQMRFRSRQDPSFAGKLLNAMRAGFGGHSIRKQGEAE